MRGTTDATETYRLLRGTMEKFDIRLSEVKEWDPVTGKFKRMFRASVYHDRQEYSYHYNYHSQSDTPWGAVIGLGEHWKAREDARAAPVEPI